jgi:hypothetical protein
MLRPSRGTGLEMRKRQRPSVLCAICSKPIEHPTFNQKVHYGSCRRELMNRYLKERRKKIAAAKAFKKERARIGAVAGRKPIRDKAYLKWIRTLPCLLCRTRVGVEAAHSGPHGISQKAPDTSALPLCFECHRTGELSYHNIGRKFFETHGLKPREELVAAYNLAYAEARETAA